MNEPVLDISELSEITRNLLLVTSKRYPKESRRFLMKEGNKLKNATKKRAKTEKIVSKKLKKYQKSHYFETVKRGKPYKFNDDFSVRVYSSAKHAHLIEDGYMYTTKKPEKRKERFIPGKKVFQRSLNQFEEKYIADCEIFLTDMIEKGLG